MNKTSKSLIKYILIYLATIFLLFVLLILVAKIPKYRINDNMQKATYFYETKAGIQMKDFNKKYSFIHYFADTVVLNIIYHLDSKHPVKSIMWDNFYYVSNADVNIDFIESIRHELPANTQYLRYWHRSILFLKPLLMFFRIEQIYLLNYLLLYQLAIALFIILLLKNKKLAIAYLISMIMIMFPMVPKCFEYSSTFYIMFISSIAVILLEKKGDKYLYPLFLITGTITCFFDFLTTEIITCFIPLIIIMSLRYEKEKKINLKGTLFFITKISLLWIIGYSLTWVVKWLLASIILNINAINYVKDFAILRINGHKGLEQYNIYTGSLQRNLDSLYPLCFLSRYLYLILAIIIIIILVLVILNRRNVEKMKYSGILFLIAIIPYIRYLFLANHSFKHCFFTYRSQIITIMSLILIITECLDFDCVKRKIKRTNYKISRGEER